MAIIYFIILSHRVPGIGGQGLHGVIPGPRQVARLLVAERQGYAGMRVAGGELEAAVQELSPFIELDGGAVDGGVLWWG